LVASTGMPGAKRPEASWWRPQECQGQRGLKPLGGVHRNARGKWARASFSPKSQLYLRAKRMTMMTVRMRMSTTSTRMVLRSRAPLLKSSDFFRCTIASYNRRAQQANKTSTRAAGKSNTLILHSAGQHQGRCSSSTSMWCWVFSRLQSIRSRAVPGTL
jgi:hypothetical protein